MPPITLVDARDLDRWANSRRAQEQLPALARRLIHATTSTTTHIGLPAGDAVQQGGYDGVVVANETHHAVPDGMSIWELGIYDRAKDGKTKNEHFRDLLDRAYVRGFEPECVLFDGWYSSLENLKAVRSYGWAWLTRLKRDRQVNPDGTGNRPLEQCAIAETGSPVHLRGYGFIRVFRIVPTNGRTEDIEYWATSELEMEETTREHFAHLSWGIEQYHRGLKQHCGIERSQVRAARAQRNHIGLSIRAFVRLERNRIRTGMSWWEAKSSIVREAVRSYLAAPRFTSGATA